MGLSWRRLGGASFFAVFGMAASYLLPLLTGDDRSIWWLIGSLLAFGLFGFAIWPVMQATVPSRPEAITAKTVLQIVALIVGGTIGVTLLSRWIDRPANPLLIAAWFGFVFGWGAAFRRFARRDYHARRSH